MPEANLGESLEQSTFTPNSELYEPAGFTVISARFKGKELMKTLGFKSSKAFAAALLGVGGYCPECGAKLLHEADGVRCTCGWTRC